MVPHILIVKLQLTIKLEMGLRDAHYCLIKVAILIQNFISKEKLLFVTDFFGCYKNVL